jgi:hypothetical protein
MKNIRSRTWMHVVDENLMGCMRIGTTEIRPDIEGLLKQMECQIPH